MLMKIKEILKAKAGIITTEVILALAIAGFAAFWYWTEIYQVSIETKGSEIKTKIENDDW